MHTEIYLYAKFSNVLEMYITLLYYIAFIMLVQFFFFFVKIFIKLNLFVFY